MSTQPAPPAPGQVRRSGSVGGGALGSALVNGVLYYLVNVAPGWQAVPFLTPATRLVLDAVNASLVTAIVANLVVVVVHTFRMRALADLVTLPVGVYAMVRLWTVFPFDVTSGWAVVIHVLLALGIVGGVVGALDALRRLVTGRR